MPKGNDACSVAAAATVAIITFYNLAVVKKTLEPETIGGKPISMEQTLRLFSSSQVPGEKCDRLHVEKNSRHICVMSCNQWYSVEVIDTEGKLISPVDILKCFYCIRKHAKNTAKNSSRKAILLPIQCVTVLNRTKWSKYRNELISSSKANHSALNCIENAIMCVSLVDHEEEKDANTDVKNLYYGFKCSQTWFDHGLSILCDSSGRCSIQGNHGVADAPPALYMVRWSQESLRRGFLVAPNAIYSEFKNLYSKDSTNTDELLPFAVSICPFDIKAWAKGAAAIKEGSNEALNIYNSFSTNIVVIDKNFAKERIKAIGLPPDAFVQICLQLAFYRMHNYVAPTYETGSTRQFFHGRTETIRSCTREVKDFCEAMDQFTANERGNAITDIVLKKFEQALSAHVDLTVDAMSGRGIDRHLLVLQLLASEIGLEHDLFTNASFLKSKSYSLSTSNISSSGWNAKDNEWAVGYFPAMIDGYGCAYTISPSCIKIMVSSFTASKETDISKFEDQIVKAASGLFELGKLLLNKNCKEGLP